MTMTVTDKLNLEVIKGHFMDMTMTVTENVDVIVEL